MYIVENRVFYTGAHLTLTESVILENKHLFNNAIPNVKLKLNLYWFNRFNTSNEYIAFEFDIEDHRDFVINTFDKNVSVDKYIKKIIIKTHPNGISSTEVFFHIDDENEQIIHFDEYLNEFYHLYSYILFELVFKLNQILETLEILHFNKQYQYGVLVNTTTKKRFWESTKFELTNDDLKLMSESYLLRVHLFTEKHEEYLKIFDAYKNNNINSIETNLIIKNNKFAIKLYSAFVLWNSDTIDMPTISMLLDLDCYTMNEIVIYNVAGEVYTELMYSINFDKKLTLNSNHLFEMYKTNAYYLQKNKLYELYFNENVNNFVTNQREIEKFKMQEETYNNSEKKFLDVYNAVETNEKSTSSRIIQNILTILTLLTIISVATGIVDFIKAKFLDENANITIDIFSRIDFIAILIILIFIMFLRLKQHMNKI